MTNHVHGYWNNTLFSNTGFLKKSQQLSVLSLSLGLTFHQKLSLFMIDFKEYQEKCYFLYQYIPCTNSFTCQVKQTHICT